MRTASRYFIVGVLAFCSGVAALKARQHFLAATFPVAITDGHYYQSRLALFRHLPGSSDVVMLGDSITEKAEWQELFPSVSIINRGIGGDTTEGVYGRLDEVISRHPKLVFLMIGINDLAAGSSVQSVVDHIKAIITVFGNENINVALQSTLYAGADHALINRKVRELNQLLSDQCSLALVRCIDLNASLAKDGKLLPDMTYDGIHLTGAAYLQWRALIAPYIH